MYYRFGLQVHSREIAVFRSKSGDQIKMFLRDGEGFLMRYDRSDEYSWHYRLVGSKSRVRNDLSRSIVYEEFIGFLDKGCSYTIIRAESCLWVRRSAQE